MGLNYRIARELAPVLYYAKYENFSKVIDRAMIACKNSGFQVSDHFPEARKMLEIGKGGHRDVLNYELSRYACYLIVQNGESRKEAIALGQTYFAIQTFRDADTATAVHHSVGKEVRAAIERVGGDMPEDLPTPDKSIAQLEKEQLAALKKKGSQLMLDK